MHRRGLPDKVLAIKDRIQEIKNAQAQAKFDREKCPICDGRGNFSQSMWGGSELALHTPCLHCNGTGKDIPIHEQLGITEDEFSSMLLQMVVDMKKPNVYSTNTYK